MKPTYIFPIVMIAMNIGAAVMCVIGKDYKKAVYWIAAAVLNACVTFRKGSESHDRKTKTVSVLRRGSTPSKT